MSGKKIIFPAFFGTLVYCLISITFGPSGHFAMKRLESERDRVTANLEKLQAVNAELDDTFRNLSSNPDTIAVYAHELGFIREDERLIKLEDFSGGIKRDFSPGTAVKAKESDTMPEWLCKAIALLGALAAFLVISRLSPEAKHDPFKTRPGIGAYYGGIPSR